MSNITHETLEAPRTLDSSLAEKITLPDVSAALKVQFRVVFALMLRDAKTRYGRHKLGFFWIFVEPVMLVMLFLAFKLMINGGNSSHGMPDALFMVTGLIPFFLFRQCMNSLSNAIKGARNLLGFPQVTTLDIILATMLLELATCLFVFAVMISSIAVLGGPETIENPLLVAYAFLLLFMTGSGMGMIFASVVPIVPAVKNITNPLFGRPLFFTSGIFFVPDMLPKSARDIVLYNPLLHMIEIMRSSYFVQYESVYINWHYAAIFAFGLFLTGLLAHQSLKNLAIKSV